MSRRLKEFHEFRTKMNEAIIDRNNRAIKRMFSLDTLTYEPGALDTKTKELLGLVTSTVLRCDDCITYHIERCWENGWKSDEILEAMSVALTVGGTIVIPHLRRAVALLEELENETKA